MYIVLCMHTLCPARLGIHRSAGYSIRSVWLSILDFTRVCLILQALRGMRALKCQVSLQEELVHMHAPLVTPAVTIASNNSCVLVRFDGLRRDSICDP